MLYNDLVADYEESERKLNQYKKICIDAVLKITDAIRGSLQVRGEEDFGLYKPGLDPQHHVNTDDVIRLCDFGWVEFGLKLKIVSGLPSIEDRMYTFTPFICIGGNTLEINFNEAGQDILEVDFPLETESLTKICEYFDTILKIKITTRFEQWHDNGAKL